MNAIATHKDDLKKLLEDLCDDSAVSGTNLVTLVDAYITRLDANRSEISAYANLERAQRRTNIDSQLRALIRATYNVKIARRDFPKISRRGPQAKQRILTGS